MAAEILSGHVLAFKENKVVIVRHEESAGHLTGVYGIPGGRPDEGESLIEAAAREFEEETGLKTSVEDLKSYPNNQYTADIERKDGSIGRFTMTVFICNKFSDDLRGREETTPEWVEVSKLNSYKLLPNVKNAVEDGHKFLKMT